jgi:dTDP-4-amino-4,6-dideoxygalactose transaminase
MIRLAEPQITEEALRAVRDVLTSGWLVQGRHVSAFEQSVADFVGIPDTVAVSSGTAALHTALLALGVGPGDEVAVSAYSYVATANVIEMCRATPVFIDIDPRTFNMDARRFEEAVAEAIRRRNGADAAHRGAADDRGASVSTAAGGGARRPPFAAMVVVHTFGQMADIESIGAIAAHHGIPVIEDAACALGATWNGRQPGATTRVACYSFHPRKALTTGEGGLLASTDPELAATARALRNHGQDPAAASPDFIMPGLNYRMTEFQAVLGSAALEQLSESIAIRRALAARYDELLADLVEVPLVPPASGHVYQSYVVLLPPEIAPRRAELIAALAQRGVESGIGTWAMPTTTYYRNRYGYTDESFPVTSEVFLRSLSLPLHDRITAEQQEQVSRALRAVLQEL